MVTIISGSIEAWVGLSAAHAYLFLEELYYIMIEAKLMRPLPSYKQLGDRFISIFTNLSKIENSANDNGNSWIRWRLHFSCSQLFTYLNFNQIERWLSCLFGLVQWRPTRRWLAKNKQHCKYPQSPLVSCDLVYSSAYGFYSAASSRQPLALAWVFNSCWCSRQRLPSERFRKVRSPFQFSSLLAAL